MLPGHAIKRNITSIDILNNCIHWKRRRIRVYQPISIIDILNNCIHSKATNENEANEAKP